jgi:hypothetical protein
MLNGELEMIGLSTRHSDALMTIMAYCNKQPELSIALQIQIIGT